jgi:hypothetical protein
MSHHPSTASPSIFLCYAHEDFERVHHLYTLLKNCGLRPWLDKYDITAGDIWPVAIEKAIRSADFFIASFSNASVKKSGYVQREYRFALDTLLERPPGSIFVIPVRLEDCQLPDLRAVGIKLSDIQWIDLFRRGPLTENDIEPILKAIEAQSDWHRSQIRLQEIFDKYAHEIDPVLTEALRVRELPYTDTIIELEARANEAQIYELGEEAFRRYLSAELQEAQRFGLETFYLIARHLYRAILEDDFAVCKHKPFIYPIHQYLSGMIRDAGAAEREKLLATLRRWISTKGIYQTSRDFAAFELGMTKAPEGTDALLEALDDPFELPLVRYYAAMSLGMIGNGDSLPRLVEVYQRESNEQIRKVLAHSIIHISKGPPTTFTREHRRM